MVECQIETVDRLLWEEYVNNVISDLEDRVESLELVVEELKALVLERFEVK